MLGSFKFKLVGTFLALSCCRWRPRSGASVPVAERSVTTSADDRLAAGLTAALAAFEDERRNTERGSETLGGNKAFQTAVARATVKRSRGFFPFSCRCASRCPAAADRACAAAGRGDDGFARGTRQPLCNDHRLGSPHDALARKLHARSGLTAPDELAIVRQSGRISAASTATLRGTIDVTPGRVATATIENHSFRALGARLGPESGVQLAALTPSSAIASEKRSLIGRLLLGLVGSLLLIAVVAYVAGRSIVGSLARLAERRELHRGRSTARAGADQGTRRVRGARPGIQQDGRPARSADGRAREGAPAAAGSNARFGDALAATLDAEQLRRVIVESAVEATHADGGVVIAEDGSFVETGDVGAGGARLDFELKAGLRSFGRLLLVGEEFDVEERMTAASLAGQAVVALENARLHQMVERQALVDGLTGLANRRQADASLATELARAERLGGPVGLILADVDDFKLVNDRHGHPTGDIVLRDLAQALHETVREIDTAARWGGEEFAVILPGTDLMGAAHVAERVRLALCERELSRRKACRCTSPRASALPPRADDHDVRARRGGR